MMNKKSIFLILPLFLSGCTDNGLLFRSSGDYPEKKENIIYMVGEPYTVQDKVFSPEEDYTYIEEGEAYWYKYDPNKPITQNGEVNSSDTLTAMHKTLPLPSIVKITNLENNKTAIVRVNDRGPMVKDRIIDVSEKTAEELNFNKEGTTKVLVEILPTESKNLKQELLKKEAEDVMTSSNALNAYYQNNIPLVTYQANPKPLQQKAKPVVKPIQENDVVYSYKEHVKTTAISSKTAINSKYVIQVGAFRNRTSAENIQNALASLNPKIVEKKVNGTVLNCVQVSGFNSKKEALIGLDKIKRAGYSDARLTSK
ncbi:MAG: septal ring lytic transglycosylase RlpA family protein [Alphaproteobacteria bacterium]|nr:septal ring lytic transglycosylase RlpA family protein [Alphaproteobacteria bacterium]